MKQRKRAQKLNQNTENYEKSEEEQNLRKKQHRKIASYGISTQKFNENAKKLIFSHKSRKYIFLFFGSFQF